MRATRRLSIALVAGLAALAALPAAAPAPPPPSNPQLGMVTFNVLAPVWAAPDWYPPDMDMSLLDAAHRANRVAARSVMKPGTQASFPRRDEL